MIYDGGTLDTYNVYPDLYDDPGVSYWDYDFVDYSNFGFFDDFGYGYDYGYLAEYADYGYSQVEVDAFAYLSSRYPEYDSATLIAIYETLGDKATLARMEDILVESKGNNASPLMVAEFYRGAIDKGIAYPNFSYFIKQTNDFRDGKITPDAYESYLRAYTPYSKLTDDIPYSLYKKPDALADTKVSTADKNIFWSSAAALGIKGTLDDVFSKGALNETLTKHVEEAKKESNVLGQIGALGKGLLGGLVKGALAGLAGSMGGTAKGGSARGGSASGGSITPAAKNSLAGSDRFGISNQPENEFPTVPVVIGAAVLGTVLLLTR